MKNMVCGFLFNEARTHVVLLLKKTGPPAVVGKWNGVGGKVEEGESSSNAMRREFMEEAGVDIGIWTHFLELNGGSRHWQVDFYHAFDDEAFKVARQMEEEQISRFAVGCISDIDVVPNLCWIIPMALGHFGDSPAYRVQEMIS